MAAPSSPLTVGPIGGEDDDLTLPHDFRSKQAGRVVHELGKKNEMDNYRACMLLSAAGDALGYRNADWEFCMDGEKIHEEVAAMGGLEKIHITCPDFMVSDDTVMHLATAEALIVASSQKKQEVLYLTIASKYKECMKDMDGRCPGLTSSGNCSVLQPHKPKGYCIPFDERSGGCGAAMRAMCIGLRYPRPEELDDLIAVSVESGRMTHHNPTGFLGSVTSALFTSYAIQKKPPVAWGAALLLTLPKVKEYIKATERYVEENLGAWDYFESHWKDYVEFRQITDGKSEPHFIKADDEVSGRDALYKSWSYNGWGGASGHDAPMIAYDAILHSGNSWKELCERGVLHGGDNDSTGAIAGAWFGAMYGLHGVPEQHYNALEYKDRLTACAGALYVLAQPDKAEGAQG